MTWRAQIVTPTDIYPDALDLYVKGLSSGRKTGWTSLDEYYTVLPGLWTLVTGYPGSGKSEFVDALLLNLAGLYGWRFCYYSPENQPQELHVAKLLEKVTGKPFFPGPTERMTADEASKAVLWLRDHFAFIRQTDGPRTINEILDLCFNWIEHSDDREPAGIVIDPWNEIEHHQPQSQTETQYISSTLTAIRQFARNTKCHIWIVAHPRLVQKDKEGRRPVPTLSDVSGGAHWWNKADFGIVVHRDQAHGNQDVEIHVQKARFKHLGKQGMVTLNYDRITGRYNEQHKAPVVPMRKPIQQWHEAHE